MRAPGLFLVCCLLAGLAGASDSPEILRISPTSGPEGTRVEISGRNLHEVTSVLFGNNRASYKMVSSEEVVAIVPHRASVSTIVVVTVSGRGMSPFPFIVSNDPRVPEEASYKSGYINDIPAPVGFSSVLLWGIAIADTRVQGHESASVEIAWTRLTCRVDGKDVVLNEDAGKVRGGLFRRHPWFGSNEHEPMPTSFDDASRAVIMPVGRRPDRTWHFWSASPRQALPKGKLQGCTVTARVKLSPGALLQMGMDYWRDPTIGYGEGGNNHEAGASNWYFPSESWQEAEFSDIGGPKFEAVDSP